MHLRCFVAASILHLIADESSTFATYKRNFQQIVTTFDESHILSTIAVAMVINYTSVVYFGRLIPTCLHMQFNALFF